MEAHGQVRQITPLPRVVLKFEDSVQVPFEAGAELALRRQHPRDPFFVALGSSTLVPHPNVARSEIQQLVDEAVERDPNYVPAAVFKWFTAEIPATVSAVGMVQRIRMSPLVEFAYQDGEPVDPLASIPMGINPEWKKQLHLGPAQKGIDAEFAWTIAGGDGKGQGLVDVEGGWTLDHEELVSHEPMLLYGDIIDKHRSHGTSVLATICAVDNATGGIGVVPNLGSVAVSSHSEAHSNFAGAIFHSLESMAPGDVLLLELQSGSGDGSITFGAPCELMPDVSGYVRLATALGFIVVQAAGNGDWVGAHDLDTLTNGDGLDVLNPASPHFQETGAIVVGAATSGVPHLRNGTSSFGARVNCFSWGEDVCTASSTLTGLKSEYTTSFNGTSAAAAIVAGAALALQGVAQDQTGGRLGPLEMRAILSDPTLGTPSVKPKDDRIGVMPDLRAALQTLGWAPPIA